MNHLFISPRFTHCLLTIICVMQINVAYVMFVCVFFLYFVFLTMLMLLSCEISIPVTTTGFILELIFEKLSKIYKDKQSIKQKSWNL